MHGTIRHKSISNKVRNSSSKASIIPQRHHLYSIILERGFAKNPVVRVPIFHLVFRGAKIVQVNAGDVKSGEKRQTKDGEDEKRQRFGVHRKEKLVENGDWTGFEGGPETAASASTTADGKD